MPRRKLRPLVLFTDFGPQSPYVGQVKLVIAAQAPDLRIIDLAHDLPPQNLAAAALVLKGAVRYLPPKAVLCAVVDPGVGSKRRILAARFAGGILAVLPDNGLLGALAEVGTLREVREVTNKGWMLRDISPVFHGRDVFAPVAARLATGVSLKKVGPRVDPTSCEPLPWTEPTADGRGGYKKVRVVYADPFGNLVTNLRGDALGAKKPMIRFAGKDWPWVEQYAQRPRGARLALCGSYGHIELAVRDGSAARAVQGRTGGTVSVRIAPGG